MVVMVNKTPIQLVIQLELELLASLSIINITECEKEEGKLGSYFFGKLASPCLPAGICLIFNLNVAEYKVPVKVKWLAVPSLPFP